MKSKVTNSLTTNTSPSPTVADDNLAGESVPVLAVPIRTKFFTPRNLFFAILILSAIIFAQFKFNQLPEEGDSANWDYMAQLIVRGGIPYRDAVNIKTPLSAYLGAAAILVLQPFGVRDIIAIRLLYLLLAVLTVGCTFLVTLDYFGCRRTALLAALIMLSFNLFGAYNSRGVEPKTLMILLGLLTLRAIHANQPVWAGLLGMLAALSWQPGLLFVGVAGLSFSNYLTSLRDVRLVKSLAGAAIPLILILIYYGAVGALKDFFSWTFAYNFTVYSTYKPRSPIEFFQRIGGFFNRSYRAEWFYFYLAVIGLVISIRTSFKSLTKGGDFATAAQPLTIILAPVIYFIFCMVQINGARDFIPLLPFIGIFAAIAIMFLLQKCIGWGTRRWESGMRFQLENRIWSALIILIFAFSVADVFWLVRDQGTLQAQDVEVTEITAHLNPGEQIFVHGATELLVLSQRPNASKYFFLDRGKDSYLDRIEPGGFAAWFERLKADRPKVVVLTRMQEVSRKTDFQTWVQGDYRKQTREFFTYYVRID